MPNYFFTRELETVSPSQRYPGWARGWQIWREFESGLPDTLPRILAELVRARASVNIATFPAGPRVFVSHKQEDAARALQIATIAVHEGFEVWVDVLEPMLQSTPADSDLDKSRKIAAIIETALLNSTHLIAVLTDNAARSRWVPYEYGRAKDSSVHSVNASCWVETDHLTDGVEYFLLGPVLHDDDEIRDWLRGALADWSSNHPGPSPRAESAEPGSHASEEDKLRAARLKEAARVFVEGIPADITAMKAWEFIRKPKP